MRETVQPSPLTLDDLRARRDDILALAARHGAYNVRVFGSVARGETTLDSDIDMLVSFHKDASIYDISGLWQDLQELLGYRVDLVTDDDQASRERFMQQVLKDAVAL